MKLTTGCTSYSFPIKKRRNTGSQESWSDGKTRMPIGWPDLVERLSEVEWESSKGPAVFARHTNDAGEGSIGKGTSSRGVSAFSRDREGRELHSCRIEPQMLFQLQPLRMAVVSSNCAQRNFSFSVYASASRVCCNSLKTSTGSSLSTRLEIIVSALTFVLVFVKRSVGSVPNSSVIITHRRWNSVV